MKEVTMTGTVVSNKMMKTVVVRIERKLRHAVYRKVIVRHKRIKAHDEMECKVGDVVKIAETRPLSKEVHFQVVEKIVKP